MANRKSTGSPSAVCRCIWSGGYLFTECGIVFASDKTRKGSCCNCRRPTIVIEAAVPDKWVAGRTHKGLFDKTFGKVR
jgi:hypothetical protein